MYLRKLKIKDAPLMLEWMHDDKVHKRDKLPKHIDCEKDKITMDYDKLEAVITEK